MTEPVIEPVPGIRPRTLGLQMVGPVEKPVRFEVLKEMLSEFKEAL